MAEYLEIVLNSSLLVALVGILYKFYADKRKKQKPFSKALEDKAQVKSLMEVFRLTNNLIRVQILKGENGGRPKPESRFYSSIVEEVMGEGSPSAKERWQKQPVDTQYHDMLNQMVSKTSHIIETSKMQTSMLKDIYVKYNIGGSVVALISENQDRMIYVSIHFKSIEDIDTANFRDNLRVFTQNLKKIFH